MNAGMGWGDGWVWMGDHAMDDIDMGLRAGRDGCASSRPIKHKRRDGKYG